MYHRMFAAVLRIIGQLVPAFGRMATAPKSVDLTANMAAPGSDGTDLPLHNGRSASIASKEDGVAGDAEIDGTGRTSGEPIRSQGPSSAPPSPKPAALKSGTTRLKKGWRRWAFLCVMLSVAGIVDALHGFSLICPSLFNTSLSATGVPLSRVISDQVTIGHAFVVVHLLSILTWTELLLNAYFQREGDA